MALGTPVAAAAAYSAQNGTTVAPAYPAGILATDVVLMFVGMKPAATTGGTVTTPANWTLREELTQAGGYTAQGADTGNTSIWAYSWNTPVAGQTGTLSVTLGGNNVTWAFMVRIPKGTGAAQFGSADGQRTTTPTSPMSIALTNGATATNFQTGDRAIWAMVIPTDVQTPTQFSAQSITATGATFGTATELNEPDSTTGNDIGGYSAWAAVTAGSSTTAPTVTVTMTGTLTNVRGPVVLLRVREAAPAPITGTLAATETGSDTFSGSGDVIVEGSMAASETGSDTFTGLGIVVSPGVTGTMAATETGADIFSGAGDVITKGVMAAAEVGADTFAASGDVIVRGAMAATETGADTFAASGDVVIKGLMAATESGTDAFAASGVIGHPPIVGTMLATETGADVFAATGDVVIKGALSATETGADTFAATGDVLVSGSMAATETGTDTLAATGTVGSTAVTGTMSAVESTEDFTNGYVYPEYVEPESYYVQGWSGTVTTTGGGGSGNAQAVVRNRKRGWANERAQFEQSQQIQEIAQTLEQSDQPQARRIARKLADYTGELAQVESLRRELAKLEAAQQSRALTAQRDRDLEAAAAELSEILRDDEDVAGALMALHEYEVKLMLGALGIAMR